MKNAIAALLAILALPTPIMAQTPRPMLDYGSAATIRDTCVAWAKERDLAVAVAVFDEGGKLIAFAHMDGASSAVGEVAQWKGRSAATIPTRSSACGVRPPVRASLPASPWAPG